MKTKRSTHHHAAKAKLRKQKGLSTMEILIYVIIAGLVILGAATAFSKWSKEDKVNTFVKHMSELPARVKAVLLPMDGDYANATTANIVALNAAPSEMVIGGTLQNVWGGSVAITPANLAGGTNNAFDTTTNNLDDESCMRAVERVQEGFVRVAINGTTVKDMTANDPLISIEVATNCTAGSNSITLTYQ